MLCVRGPWVVGGGPEAAAHFPCRGQRRGRVRDSGGYYLQMLQARADGGLSSSASWFTVAYERDLPTAVEMALLIESDLFEHGSRKFRS